MQFPTQAAIMPQAAQILTFIDTYFETTPIDEITPKMLIEKAYLIGMQTNYYASINQMTSICIELDAAPQIIQDLLEWSYRMSPASELSAVYQLAISFNNKSIYGNQSKKTETDLAEAMGCNRNYKNWRALLKNMAETTHQPLQGKS
jgi:hypothetical protein